MGTLTRFAAGWPRHEDPRPAVAAHVRRRSPGMGIHPEAAREGRLELTGGEERNVQPVALGTAGTVLSETTPELDRPDGQPSAAPEPGAARQADCLTWSMGWNLQPPWVQLRR